MQRAELPSSLYLGSTVRNLPMALNFPSVLPDLLCEPYLYPRHNALSC